MAQATSAKQSTKTAESKTPEQCLEWRKDHADNTTVGLIRRVLPATTKSGKRIDGKYIFALDLSAQDENGKKHTYQTMWFTVWNQKDGNNPVADQLIALTTSWDYAIVRVYWEFSQAKSKDISFQDGTDAKTGKSFRTPVYKYRLDRKVFAFDTVFEGVLPNTEDEEA